MTREEAMKWLKRCAFSTCEECEHEVMPIEWCDQKMQEAVMAIEALTSQNPTEPNNTCEVDLISRADAIEVLAQVVFDEPPYLDSESLCRMYAEDKINALPSAEAEPKWTCTANFVAEQLERLKHMTDEERLKLLQTLFPSAESVVWCKDCCYQEHCHKTVAHTKDHDGFREHWSEPIEWCSQGERREP